MRVAEAEPYKDLRTQRVPARRYATIPAYDKMAACIAVLAPLTGALLVALTLVLMRG